MLGAPPPGFNPFATNRQQVVPYTVPGQQGWSAQGYMNHPFNSGTITPSSVQTPHPGMPGVHPQGSVGNAAMMTALRGGVR